MPVVSQAITHSDLECSRRYDVDSYEAWTRHTINMPVVSQAITHSDLEYSRRYDVDSYEAWKDGNPDAKTDKGNKKRSTKEPRRESELRMIAEVVQLSKMFVEMPGRKFNLPLIWDVLPSLTTDLAKVKPGGDDDDDHDDDDDNDDAPDEDAELSRLAATLLSQGSEVGGSSDMAEVDDIAELIDASNLQTAEATVADADEALLGDNNDDDEDEPLIPATLDPGATTRPAEITVGARKPRKVKNVRKAALNVMALNDTFAVGEAKLAAKNLVQVRYRRKCRAMREQVALQDNLYEFLKNMGGNFHDVIAKIDTLNTMTVDDVPEHRRLAQLLRNKK